MFDRTLGRRQKKYTQHSNEIVRTIILIHRYKARRDEDIAEDEIQIAMRNLETSKGDCKKHAQAMEMLKKAREHRKLAHAHFETSKKHHMMAQQLKLTAEREEKVAMRRVEKATAAESAIDEAIIDGVKNPVFEKHDDKDWLHKLEQDHHVHMHTPSEIAKLVKKHDAEVMEAAKVEPHPIRDHKHDDGHGDLSDIEDEENHDDHHHRHHTPSYQGNRATGDDGLHGHMVHGHHVGMFTSLDNDFFAALEHDEHEEIESLHEIKHHSPSPAAKRQLGRYNSHEKEYHQRKKNVPTAGTKKSGGGGGGGGCCVVM